MLAKPAAAALEVIGLVRSFGHLTAVAGLSLSVFAGEILALLGPNGAGKTTIMRMLTGLLKPDRGEIRILGQTHHSLHRVQRWQVGYCPQGLVVWRDLTCLEQLVLVGQMYRLGGTETRRRANAMLESFGLITRAHELAAVLSSGMQRRLSIALALMHEPAILILDEPTAGLDPQSRVLVRERLRALCHEQHRAILVSTHDMEEADRMADRVAIVDHGELLALDTPANLKRGRGADSLIEVVLTDRPPAECESARAALVAAVGSAWASGNTVLVEAPDVAASVGVVRAQLHSLGIEPVEIRVRRWTLEDRFIEITGRRLRE